MGISKRVIVMGTSRRKDGPMGFRADFNDREAIKNRDTFFWRIKIRKSRVVIARLTHGVRVKSIDRIPPFRQRPVCDALITNNPEVFLAITTADCFPVFFFDTKKQVVGIAHAGWRGVVKNIVPKVLKVIQQKYAIPAKRVHAVIGPGIRQCHFEVWPESHHRSIRSHLRRYHQFVRRGRGGRTFVDLAGVIAYQLKQGGVDGRYIRDRNQCTFHLSKQYFSYRRDRDSEYPFGFGNMISIIGITSNTSLGRSARWRPYGLVGSGNEI